MFSYTDPSRPVSVYTTVPLLGIGKEPEWFTRRVAAATRLEEIARQKRIAHLTAGRPESDGVVVRVKTALGLA